MDEVRTLARPAAAQVVRGVGPHFTDTASGDIERYLRALGHGDQIDRVLAVDREASWLRAHAEARAAFIEERDAAHVMLLAAGIDRTHVFEEYKDPPTSQHLVEANVLREDALINADATTFGRMKVVRELPVAGHVFEGRDGRRLTILNVNREPLETTTGVDLIYYSVNFDAYVIVQYKRLRPDEHGGRAFRPTSDPRLGEQLEKMKALAESTTTQPTSSTDVRLGGGWAYVKLCDPYAAVRSGDLVRGMYVDARVWDVVSAESLGPNGGVAMGWDTVPRYLSNSQFAELVGDGWIGSRGAQTSAVESLVAAAVAQGRSAMLGQLELSGPAATRRRVFGR
jgi:hypothetical protein